MIRFSDRADAGRQLATRLTAYANRDDVVVLALPRGGVPVGCEVAHALHAALDVFLVRKLGVPGHPELAMGAIASGGVRVVSRGIVDELGIAAETIERIAEQERIELERRDRLYRGTRSLPALANRIVILVDDGLATGATMEAAIAAVRQFHPARIVVASPVGARETCQRLSSIADEVVCAEMPNFFQAVGLWYAKFDQTTDDEVIDLLSASASLQAGERRVDPRVR
ncbi:MAG TPA: phosphoribosyltransferase [Vicinamibacterales bacterium]|nr:phosphoribosyltransferase [Vicinamibacterales bacterium]